MVNTARNLLIMPKQSAASNAKRVIWKTAEATVDLIGNKIFDKITEVSKNLSETVTNDHDKEIPKERYGCP